ncbi:Hypothetical predicted protein [Mytilus galloprovincialis]|uniref:DZIP3-like HEPN domain-containing protein n=1 Tax=Mytilus galloprovincialis TaxID=29158 RepID=A0A8B6FIF9_MYTGA|nr:Hypothetical predicted protein [Mytilus galloprovincialis]
MEAIVSDKQCGYYVKLITFILGIGMEVLHTYFEQNILNAKEHLEFYMFLDENKHNLYHECYPKVKCCKCSQNCRDPPSKKGSLSKKQFMLLFECGPLIEIDHYKTGNHNEITKECLCRIMAKRSNDVDCMDITLMYAIIQSCCFKNSTVIHGNPRCIEVIKETRNFLAHVTNARISKFEYDSRWLETEQAILEIGSSLGNYFAKLYKRKIDEFKNSELSMDAIKGIIENNVDEVIKKKLQTIIEDQRKCIVQIKEEIIDHLRKYKDELSIDIQKLRFEVKQSASCSTEEGVDKSAGPVSQMHVAAGGPDVQVTEKDNNVRKCRVEWRLETPNTWNLPEIKETLEKFSSLLRQWFEIEFVYVGSLVLSTLVKQNVLDNPDQMRTSIQLFLEKVVELCKINADVPTVIKVDLIIKLDELVHREKETENITSELDIKQKDKTTCIYCNLSFEWQKCQQKDEIIERLTEEISDIRKESAELDLEMGVPVAEQIFDDSVNKAQVATGNVISQKTYFARLGHATFHLIPNMMRELLAHVIHPNILYETVHKNKSLMYRLKYAGWQNIHNIKETGYRDLDYQVMYTIIRICLPKIQPSRGWDNPMHPNARETSLGDDIERCRRYLNSIIHRGNTTVSYQELIGFLNAFKDVARRFEKVLGKEPNAFVSQFEVLKTCSMDEDI